MLHNPQQANWTVPKYPKENIFN